MINLIDLTFLQVFLLTFKVFIALVVIGTGFTIIIITPVLIYAESKVIYKKMMKK